MCGEFRLAANVVHVGLRCDELEPIHDCFSWDSRHSPVDKEGCVERWIEFGEIFDAARISENGFRSESPWCFDAGVVGESERRSTFLARDFSRQEKNFARTFSWIGFFFGGE